jgi:hypothetical protein
MALTSNQGNVRDTYYDFVVALKPYVDEFVISFKHNKAAILRLRLFRVKVSL